MSVTADQAALGTGMLGAMPPAFSARYHASWSGHIAVLSPGPVPSVDFYLTPRFVELDQRALHHFDSRIWQPGGQQLPPGTFIVIVRHASTAWLRFIEQHSARWSGVAFLLDDDLASAWRCRELPWDYRLRTSARFHGIVQRLTRICDRAWVSTETLRQRYASWNPTLLPPLNPFQSRSAAPLGSRRWCYHGTRAHIVEMHWLKPVVSAVQNRVPDAEFEIMGGTGIKRLFAGIPRVSVIAPKSWVDYQAYCSNAEIAVGLAPLLGSKFNATRAHVKIFDIAHCGAVGIYSNRAPYFPALTAAGAEFAGDDRHEWSDKIAALLHEDERRREMYETSSAWIELQRPAKNLADLIARD